MIDTSRREHLFLDNRSNPISGHRMGLLGAKLGASLDKLLDEQFLDRSLAPVVLASALLGEAKRLNWTTEQVHKLLQELTSAGI